MTPAETAKNEAAKQAVILAFGVVSMLLMVKFYKSIAARQADAMRGAGLRDPVMADIEAAEARQRASERAAKTWDRLTTLAFRYGPDRLFSWTWDRAEAARKAARP